MRDGLCIRCATDEAGEAIGRIHDGASTRRRIRRLYRRSGHRSARSSATCSKRGDAWYRTGDLMRKDDEGFFYFVDRIGDTFRWKGENVATSEVAAVIAAFPGVAEASVYGVTVPGTEGAPAWRRSWSTARFDSPRCARIWRSACRTMPGRCFCASSESIETHRDIQAQETANLRAKASIRATPPIRSCSTIRASHRTLDGAFAHPGRHDRLYLLRMIHFGDRPRQSALVNGSRCGCIYAVCTGIDRQDGAGDVARLVARAESRPHWRRRRPPPSGATRCAARFAGAARRTARASFPYR